VSLDGLCGGGDRRAPGREGGLALCPSLLHLHVHLAHKPYNYKHFFKEQTPVSKNLVTRLQS
jgi:hypothetical protein